jgi:predicted RNase H-like HicB family nuclease
MQRITDKYFRWVEWSEEDQCYIGRCPDLFGGGVHSDDELDCARKLHDAIEDVGNDLKETGAWPPVKTRPMQEVC